MHGSGFKEGGYLERLKFFKGGGVGFSLLGGGYLERLKFLSLSNLLHSENFKGGGGVKKGKNAQ